MPGVILAVVVHPDRAPRLLDAAAHLAGLAGSERIDVLAIRLPPTASILPGEEVLTRQLEQSVRDREQQRAATLRAAFESWRTMPGGQPVVTGWADVEATVEEVVRERGSHVDFIVLDRPVEGDKTSLQAIQCALFETDRPVLVVPPAPFETIGRRIAIAWRDDKRTIRSVLSSLRCLSKAEEIHVLAGVRGGAPHARLPEVLGEHGVTAHLHELAIGPSPFGAALLAQAHALAADLLVVGAFVHSPLHTMVLGGVTRYMLDHADLPLLMRH